MHPRSRLGRPVCCSYTTPAAPTLCNDQRPLVLQTSVQTIYTKSAEMVAAEGIAPSTSEVMSLASCCCSTPRHKMIVAVGIEPTRLRSSTRSRALIRRARSPEPATEIGAGNGNRTRVSSVARLHSTTEPCPRIGGPTENRTQRADLARISRAPAPGPKNR